MASQHVLRLHELSLAEIVQALTSFRISRSECILYFLDRIQRLNAGSNAVVQLLDRHADLETLGMGAGELRRPLEGVPFLVKDSLDVEGFRTVCGAAVYTKRGPASRDARIVSRLRALGGVPLGKTNLPALSLDVQSFNEVYGTTENPYAYGYTAGGSSGGSAAAVALGLAPLAVGTDWAGSLRIPASFCGVCTLRASRGRMTVDGRDAILPPMPLDPLDTGEAFVAGLMTERTALLHRGVVWSRDGTLQWAEAAHWLLLQTPGLDPGMASGHCSASVLSLGVQDPGDNWMRPWWKAVAIPAIAPEAVCSGLLDIRVFTSLPSLGTCMPKLLTDLDFLQACFNLTCTCLPLLYAPLPSMVSFQRTMEDLQYAMDALFSPSNPKAFEARFSGLRQRRAASESFSDLTEIIVGVTPQLPGVPTDPAIVAAFQKLPALLAEAPGLRIEGEAGGQRGKHGERTGGPRRVVGKLLDAPPWDWREIDKAGKTLSAGWNWSGEREAALRRQRVAEVRQEQARWAAAGEELLASAGVAAWILPVCGVLPFKHNPDHHDFKINGRDVPYWRPLRGYVVPFVISGHPVVSMPMRLINGLPLGMQVVGSMGQDEALLSLCVKLERLLGRIPSPPMFNSQSSGEAQRSKL